MNNKIINHYKLNFSSSPIEVDIDDINLITKNECKCYSCDRTIFEMYDFPELLFEENQIMCEECYDQEYRKMCPICEDSYDIKEGKSEYSVLIKGDEDYLQPFGIYKNGKHILHIDINTLKKVDCGEKCCKVWSDDICSGCVSEIVRKENYMKSHGDGTPCILMKKYDNTFQQYTETQIKTMRRNLVLRRINVRGIIESANKR